MNEKVTPDDVPHIPYGEVTGCHKMSILAARDAEKLPFVGLAMTDDDGNRYGYRLDTKAECEQVIDSIRLAAGVLWPEG